MGLGSLIRKGWEVQDDKCEAKSLQTARPVQL